MEGKNHRNWRTLAETKSTQKLEPGENLSFAHELRISTTKEEKFVMVEGFFYCDEIKNGIGTLNKITINF